MLSLNLNGTDIQIHKDPDTSKEGMKKKHTKIQIYTKTGNEEEKHKDPDIH